MCRASRTELVRIASYVYKKNSLWDSLLYSINTAHINE